ncbi:MAG: inositol monophosphatase [Candidatus Nealsonbacteria bacterium]|nr:MAG: inositol monophosphatase [Candidatus Nealsonbacteria bacterium]
MTYLKVAVKAAKKAGEIHKKYFNKGFKVKTKTSSFDLLTVADTESEKAIVSIIKKYFPEHNILAEEYKYEKTKSEYTWIIDPLDGTNNFASGLPIFCASVALARNDEVIAGVVYDVSRNELFYAQKNKGAFLNGKRIHVAGIKNLKRALLITGFYYSRGDEMIQTLNTIKRFFLKRIMGLRRLGAAALDLCYIACGRASGFWEFELSPWDFAAGKLLVEEAGGKVSGKNAEKVPLKKKYYIVASNGKIHRQMLETINVEK